MWPQICTTTGIADLHMGQRAPPAAAAGPRAGAHRGRYRGGQLRRRAACSGTQPRTARHSGGASQALQLRKQLQLTTTAPEAIRQLWSAAMRRAARDADAMSGRHMARWWVGEPAMTRA